MVDYEYANLFLQSHVDKQLKIVTDDGSVTITNEDLYFESFELSESICSDSELIFGSCETGSVKFKIANVFTPLKDKWITVTLTIGANADNPLALGRYKVYSDTPTADKRYREIVAYDAMYDIINAEMSDWYNEILPNTDSTVTLKEFRTSFISYFGLVQEEIDLANDEMIVERTVEPSELSGKDIITAICELNGCFGHIGRNGEFRYILLPKSIQGLYPANDLYPADDLLPKEPKTEKIPSGLYISCTYEDYVTDSISKLQIRQEENDIGTITGSGDNCYIVEDNFLVYGKDAVSLGAIAENLYSIIEGVQFRPANIQCVGNPCLELGDAVRLSTKYALIETYILTRTLTGIQSLKDVYEANGEKQYSRQVNSVQKSIVQIKGKTNVLERTIEETKSTIVDVEKGLQTQITQNAGLITAEVTRAKGEEEKLSSSISLTAEAITSEVTRAINSESTLSSKITQTSSSITSMLSQQIKDTKTYADNAASTALTNANNNTSDKLKYYTTTVDMKSYIQQTANSITSTVAQSNTKWDIRAYWHNVDYVGYGTPQEAGYSDIDTYKKHTYLDVNTGYIYYCTYDDGEFVLNDWFKDYECPTVVDSVYTEIKQTNDSITSTVSDMKTYADSAASTATTNANSNTEEKLKNYTTTENMQSLITQTANSIKSIVASSITKWDANGYHFNIDYVGYGTPWDNGYTDINAYRDKSYLDVNTGYVYHCTYNDGSFVLEDWFKDYECPTIVDSVYSEIKQTNDNISLKVSKNSIVSEINQSAEEIKISASKILLDGMVVANATFTTPTLNSAIINGGAISIGGNNIIMNEAGIWVIGLGTADDPMLKIANDGTTVANNFFSSNAAFTNACYLYENTPGLIFKIAENEPYPLVQINKMNDDYQMNLGNLFSSTHIYSNDTTYIYSKLSVNGEIRTTGHKVIYSEDDSIVSFQNKDTYMEVSCNNAAYAIPWTQSDIRLKKNIKINNDSILNKIKNICFYSYDWKSNDSHENLGIIADQIEEIFPDVVYQVAQPNGDTLKNINTYKLMIYVLKAIQELTEV